MLKHLKVTFISLLLILCSSSSLALNVNMGGGGGVCGIETQLADSTNFVSAISLNELTLDKETKASGSGENSIKESASNGKDSIHEAVLSSGNLDMQSSTIASSNAVASSQKVNLKGDKGYIANSLDSPSSDVDLSAGVSGKGGYLSTDIAMVAAGSADVAGSANVMGDEYLNSEAIRAIDSLPGTVLKSVDGAFLTQNGDIGSFGVNILKNKKNVAANQNPSLYGTIYRWPDDPKIRIYLRTVGVPATVGASNAASAIGSAAEVWDASTSQNLFYDSGVSTTSSMPNFYFPDYKNVHGFSSYYDPSVIAVTNTWYFSSGQYAAGDGAPLGKAVDSDCIYNTRFQWSITPSNTKYEVGDIALHELGHTLGLRDFYGADQSSWVMYGLRGLTDTPKTALTPDDATMLQYLYGA
jgi:hypothetical protein